MLALGFNPGESAVFRTETGELIGTLVYPALPRNKDRIRLAFNFPKSVRIIRSTLLKDGRRGQRQQ